MHNLLQEPLFDIETRAVRRRIDLPGVFAAAVADEIDTFVHLRPHQQPAWHMFLVQLGAIAMHRAGLTTPPADADTWRAIIRDLTLDGFPNDEPWRLVVEDQHKPAFLQPPVPTNIGLDKSVSTPDALDMLITSKNHDVKQAIAARAPIDAWIYALVSLQTCEGFGGRGNYGIARMNGGSSSRALVRLEPLDIASRSCPHTRPGQQLIRDVQQLASHRSRWLESCGFEATAQGPGLLWTLPWPDDATLSVTSLDPWFIEVCRRVRFRHGTSGLTAVVGNSEKARLNAEGLKGSVGDPWAPVHLTENKALTIGDDGDFNYRRFVDLFLSGEWRVPLLATLGPRETADTADFVLVAQAFARGNSKTGGFRERRLPLRGRQAQSLLRRRQELHDVARMQIADVGRVDMLLRNAIATAAAGGDKDKVQKKHRLAASPWQARLDAEADRLFFPSLWARFDAAEAMVPERIAAARMAFQRELLGHAEALLDEACATIPCPSVRRPRAIARATRQFDGQKRSAALGFPELFVTSDATDDASEVSHVD